MIVIITNVKIDNRYPCPIYSLSVTTVIDTGLSAAAIAGIIAGSLCLLLLVFGVIRAIIHKYQSKQLMNQLMEEMKKQPTANEYSEKDFWGDDKPVEE